MQFWHHINGNKIIVKDLMPYFYPVLFNYIALSSRPAVNVF